MLSIAKCLLGVVVASHWMACAWILQAFVAGTTPLPSWLGDDGYCVASEVEPRGFVCQPAGSMYMASLYWSVMTITSVGYGDVAATPFNATEQATCTVLMLVSSVIYAQVGFRTSDVGCGMLVYSVIYGQTMCLWRGACIACSRLEREECMACGR